MLYRFDKKLRLLLFNEIEKIEVAVRNAIVRHGCEVTGAPFWMTNPNNFSNPVKFNKTIRLIEDELNHSKEEFITHFKETDSDPTVVEHPMMKTGTIEKRKDVVVCIHFIRTKFAQKSRLKSLNLHFP